MRVLHLGLMPPSPKPNQIIIHYPVIRIEPLQPSEQALSNLSSATHLIFTSKTSVALLAKLINPSTCVQKVIVVGSATKQEAILAGFTVYKVANQEIAEGVVESLAQEDLSAAHVFWPRSAKARSVISDYLRERAVALTELILYDTHLQRLIPIPSLEKIDQIVFTSPSTVDGFMEIFGHVPTHVDVVCKGPVTAKRLGELGF